MDIVSVFKVNYLKRFRVYLEDVLAKAVRRSGIDRRANSVCVRRVKRVSMLQRRLESRRQLCFSLLFLMGGGGLFFGFYLRAHGQLEEGMKFLILYIVAVVLIMVCLVMPSLQLFNRRLTALGEIVDRLKEEAREAIAPFYRCLGGDVVLRLIERVLPGVAFDNFLSQDRVEMCERIGGCAFTSFVKDKSMVASYCGCFFGYPFICYNAKRFYWGEKVYTGTKLITWTTRERDGNGRMRTVFHSQTLVASVRKPYPCFEEEKRFLFAHPEAPNLSFSRTPSSIAGETGIFANLKRRLRRRKLKKFEANLTDESNYTMVNNEEFEVLFNASNRDHEVEFRVLFTPLAQQQMVYLLNDRMVGYGDNFSYTKLGCLTVLDAEHLQRMNFRTDLHFTEEYDFDRVLNLYRREWAEFFRMIYFTFAPLYAIPAYQAPVPEEEIPEALRVSRWEFEAMAHRMDCMYVLNPESQTENLFFAEEVAVQEGCAIAQMTALGFRGEERLDVQYVYGRDGNLHRVNVWWEEFSAVQRSFCLSARRIEGTEMGHRTGFEHKGFCVELIE